MDIVRVIVALVIAIIVYVVLVSFIAFQHSALIFGLVALVLFLLIAFGGLAGARWGRRL